MGPVDNITRGSMFRRSTNATAGCIKLVSKFDWWRKAFIWDSSTLCQRKWPRPFYNWLLSSSAKSVFEHVLGSTISCHQQPFIKSWHRSHSQARNNISYKEGTKFTTKTIKKLSFYEMIIDFILDVCKMIPYPTSWELRFVDWCCTCMWIEIHKSLWSQFNMPGCGQKFRLI